MDTESDTCRCRRPDLVPIVDLWTCMACGALSPSSTVQPQTHGSSQEASHDVKGNQSEVCNTDSARTQDWLSTEDLRQQPSVPAYKHTKLDHDLGQKNIRLINLFYGQYDDPIQCSIHHVALEDKPHYEAVSYTWGDEAGDSTLSSTIYCLQTALRVTKNCERALRRIRLPVMNRWIWLDAVAINQNDIGERNHQVAMMKEIYSRAHRVLIYAGEESHSSDKLLRFLGEPKNDAEFRALQGQQERLRRHRFSPNLKDFHVTMGIWPHHRYYDLGDLQGAMARLLSRPWFRRTWVLQEAYLAARATMIVGEKTLDWSLMCKPRLIECCLYKEEDNATLPGVLEWMERQRANDIDLLFALKTTRTCLATDPRDKVFALLGLLHDPSALGFEVNYSWTLKEVLTQVAAHLITTSNSIGILRYAGGTSSSSSIPSWAPNWSSESGDSLTAQFTSAVTPDTSTIWGYVAERKSLMPISSHNLHHNPLTDMRFATSMVVSGVCLDTIQYLLDDEFMETRCHFENDEGFTRETKQKAFPCDCKHSFLARLFSIGPADDVSTVYSHNLGEWIYPVLFRTGAISTCGHCTDSRVFGSSNSSAAGNIWASEDNVPLAEAFNIKEMNVFGRQRELQGTNKTSFQTHLTLGFGPKSVQCGDTVWRIRGLDVPLILRRCGENWQVVGECYLHGAERFVTQDQVEESISLR